MVIVNTVVYVRVRLGGTDSDTALAFAAIGAGSMIVALALPRFLVWMPNRTFMLAGGFLSAAGLLLGLAAPGFPGLLVLWFLLGAGASLVQTPAGRLLKRSAREGDRPAIFAAQFALSHACPCAEPHSRQRTQRTSQKRPASVKEACPPHSDRETTWQT